MVYCKLDNILLRKASDEEVKKYLLIILKEFDDFCEKHNLQYLGEASNFTLIVVICLLQQKQG